MKSIIKTKKGESAMTNTLEMKMNILSVAQVLAQYFEAYPDDILTKFQLAHKGPFYKYAFVGNDGNVRHTLELNAQTGDVLKDKAKDLRPKDQDPARREAKTLNLENLLPLNQITDLALNAVAVKNPVQWELDRKGPRTLWKVEITNDTGANMHEVKIDAQDGTILQTKLKN